MFSIRRTLTSPLETCVKQGEASPSVGAVLLVTTQHANESTSGEVKLSTLTRHEPADTRWYSADVVWIHHGEHGCRIRIDGKSKPQGMCR